jgi:glycosyltransferase involved in cell wall biosynthesis
MKKSPIITIGIPQYKEDEEKIYSLLSMINNQVGINFDDIEVIICNDASDVILSDEFLNSFYNFTPQYIKLVENVGPGLCRQAILDEMNGKYVLFCDGDDTLHSIAVIGLYLDLIKKNPDMDIIYTSWLEELEKEDGSFLYIEHKSDATWCHSKLLKKCFIDHLNVRFHPQLRVHEDSYFLGLLFELTTKKLYVDITTYLWKYGKESITRIDNSIYTYNSIPVFVQSILFMVEELEKRGHPKENTNLKILQLLLYIYFTLQLSAWWNNENTKIYEYRVETEKMLHLLLTKYKDVIENYSQQEFNTVYNEERKKVLLPVNEIEKENFTTFYQRMLNNY